jgi:dynein intermediate chain
MSEDKRKKLEELKKRTEMLRKEAGNAGSNSPEKSSAAAATSNSRVEQIIKEATISRAPDMNLEDIKRKSEYLKTNMTKYKSEVFEMKSVFSETIVGKNPEVYDEGIQVDLGGHSNKRGSFDSDEEEFGDVVGELSSHLKIPTGKKPDSRKPSVIQSDGIRTPETFQTQASVPGLHKQGGKIIMNEDSKRQLLNSQELSDFLGSKSKLIERALGEKDVFDMFKTYYDEDGGAMDVNKRSWINNAVEFFDHELCNSRAVNSLSWSNKHQELLLASYTKSDDYNINNTNGLILLWSLALRKAPEFQFTCQTELTSAIFHKFEPKYVIGASYTGQILIWDTRGKSLPVYKTPPAGKFHSHPIYCLGVIGLPNANSIISVSNDGVLCTWSMSNLSKPTKRIELKSKRRRQFDSVGGELSSKVTSTGSSMEEIGAICMATQENETNNIFIGTDDSDIFQIYAHQGNDTQENVVETYRKHTGPVHSLNMHPGDYHKNANFNHLFLSASADWTVNLWSKNFSDAPIFTFDQNDDYVYDAQFHPTNPSLFASCDGLGSLDFWDLNKDTEVPLFRYDTGKNALNKMSWSNDGKRLAVGDIAGKVSVFNVEKEVILFYIILIFKNSYITRKQRIL